MIESKDNPAITMFVCGGGSQGCPKRPGILDHDWSGPVVEFPDGAAVTCKYCKIAYDVWAILHLP